MSMNQRDGYVSSATDTIERECDRCGWHAVAGSYPELVKQYQDHLRDEHPTAWLRS